MTFVTRLLPRLSHLTLHALLAGALVSAMAMTAPVNARAASGSPDTLPADTTGIRSVVHAFADAWGRGDATAIASLFTADGDLVIPTGLQVRGRSNLRDFYASAFAKGYAGSTTTADIVRIRKIAADVMVIDASWSIVGAKLPQGKASPPERGILAAVIVRSEGRWWITALREQEGAAALTSFGMRDDARGR